jgi:excisionase family DNA binding protein
MSSAIRAFDEEIRLGLREPFRSRQSMTASATLPRNDRQLVFTSSQAASYLGVSLATVRRWTDAGYVSCYRTPGGQRRFARQQLDEFITSMHRDGSAAQVDAGPAVHRSPGTSANAA